MSCRLSIKEAQKLVLNAQLLVNSTSNTLDIIQKLGYIQIDTLSVTERCHHHILFTRNKNYQKSELNELLKKQHVFEYWSHAAAYLPIEGFRYSLYRKEQFKSGDSHWFKKDKRMMEYVLDRITAEGPLQSKNFKNATSSAGSWYDWKPAKNALEQLFMEGSLMIKQRNNFQKVYDLPERVYLKSTAFTVPSKQEYAQYLISTAINAQGLVTAKEIGYLRKGMQLIINQQLIDLVENKELIECSVEGDDSTYYSTSSQINAPLKQTNELHLISPFDNLIIQRNRTNTLFGLDYIIECYVTQAKRKYGYYTIPILYKGQFVGRFDAKADRKQNKFFLHNCWWEDDFKKSEKFETDFYKSLQEFALFCGVENLVIDKKKLWQ